MNGNFSILQLALKIFNDERDSNFLFHQESSIL